MPRTASSPSRRRAASPAKRERAFGDHMAAEAEISHIPSILILMYAGIMLYALLTAKLTGTSLATIPTYYSLGMIAFYAWHHLAHSSWTGEMHRLHMRHHLKAYPPSAFYGATADTICQDMGAKRKEDITFLFLCNPFRTTTNSIRHEGPLYIFLLLIMGGGLLAGTEPAALAFVLLGYGVMGIVGNALHMSFHVKGFELERYEWYMELRSLHYIHHLGDMHSNLGMLNLGIDGLFGSLALSDPVVRERDDPVEQPKQSAQGSGGGAGGDGSAMDPRHLRKAARSSGLVAVLLGFEGVPLDVARFGAPQAAQRIAWRRGIGTVAVRALVVYYFMSLYGALQVELRSSTPLVVDMRDAGHAALGSVHALLAASPPLLRGVCALSQLSSEVACAALILASVLGSTFRPALGGCLIVGLRVALCGVTALPIVTSPHKMWDPSAAVDLFFPGQAASPTVLFSESLAIALVLLIESSRLAPDAALPDESVLLTMRATPRAIVVGLGSVHVALKMVLMLGTRSNWSFEIILAFIFARYATIAAARLAPVVDALLP